MEDENTNMLEVIFRAREEELASLNNADKNFFKVHNIKRCAKRDSLNAELETMPKDFNQLKENIKIKLDDYVETIEDRINNILENKNFNEHPEFPRKNLLIETTNYCNNKCY